MEEDVVIVGAGIAGLAISLALHRLGIRSLVLESADALRSSGYALAIWPNAWKALDAIGIGDVLRQQHTMVHSLVTVNSSLPPRPTAHLSLLSKGHEVRHVNRKFLIQALMAELPQGTVRFSSKVVGVHQDSGGINLLHLADGSTVKANKVLIGCDGVNSVVAQFLGFSRPSSVGRASIRGHVEFGHDHHLLQEHNFLQFYGNGSRFGMAPCGTHGLYWFFTYIPSSQDTGIEEDPAKMKQLVCSRMGHVSDEIASVLEKTDLSSMIWSKLRFRHPWSLVWGNISKDNVCVAGDALHPMTPDIGQGGCSSLEDALVLARILGQALTGSRKFHGERLEQEMIKNALKQYARERRWRSINLITAAYVVGFIQQSNGIFISFLRDKLLPKFLVGIFLKISNFDCGNLKDS